ncbi:hypothetical protein ABZ905_16565 [Streptomyces parvus]|uniref:hypothetical protein n=1 Tax=Streptomyces parvus TaxID=66428 RepID=UPI0033EE1D29
MEELSGSVDRTAAQLLSSVHTPRATGIETVRGGAAIAVRVASLLVSASEDIALLDRPPYVHTVRRRITRLMRALNAETRFQAGVQAALRVWFTG